MKFILIAVIILLFFPIPVFFKFTFENKKFLLFIYNFKIQLKHGLLETEADTEHEIKKPSKVGFGIFNAKNMLHALHLSKFKPTLRLNLDMTYGFEDAAITAIVYGVINSFYQVLYDTLDSFLKVKSIKFNITPKYNISMLNFTVHSIIFISFAKIIYITFQLIRFEVINSLKKHN